ncbi:hypothetical protein [Alkalicoccus saliphilus]|uniref:Uncharacterized protein n=1 Tax=Alkalicoccus saliphilus TaxID=200989 RepID=A0A2T4U401_9BACI|nr:hypothetical protein [Alkalicoccus saliphilus]PTL38124.1 hypothetical protein C6Y45_13090 [Alkalicoccus saliphilus]
MRKKNDTDMTLEQASNSLMKEMMGEDETKINSKKLISDGERSQQGGQECLKCQKDSRKLLLALLNQNTVLHRKARG